MIEKKSKRILEGYKRNGKRFIPPIALLKNIQELSSVNQLLPETIWMGLINERLGYKKGIELAFSLATITNENCMSDKFVNFALCSSYTVLKEEEKLKVVERLEKNSNLPILRTCIAPLIMLYEECPLNFLGTNKDVLQRPKLISQIKTCVKNHIDKYSVPGLAIQAEVAYIRGATGGLYLPEGMEPPDLNAMLDEPNSEKGEKASAFVRAFALSEILEEGDDDKYYWPREFWNQGVRIDKCELEDKNNE